MLLMRPDAAHRVTVFGSTRNRAATSPGVRRRSLLPSTHVPLLTYRSGLMIGLVPSVATNDGFLPSFLKTVALI
jgi:hypothetical protein